jgi:hypothetical protein
VTKMWTHVINANVRMYRALTVGRDRFLCSSLGVANRIGVVMGQTNSTGSVGPK